MTLRSHNDISGLVPVPSHGLTAAVVIPVFERPDLLERTLAGLERSTVPVSVIVVDDGSAADIRGVVEAARIDARYLRQERNGYGAGRARNLGAAAADDADVVVFIDADCIPEPDLVDRHLAWHGASDLLVTVGSRRHVEAADVSPSAIARGTTNLTGRGRRGPGGGEDFRAVLRRRTGGLRAGDEAFRTFVSSNVAVRRRLFHQVGGFDERFRRWGGEDTELGWRLWQAGAFFVPAEDAVIHHQLDEDRSGGREGRDASRTLNDGLIATLIPHSFYRKPRRDLLYEIPKVSLVVHHPPARLDDLWRDVSGQTAPDLELVLCGTDDSHEPAAGLLAGDPRVRLATDLDAGIGMARGELVVVVHGSVALDHRALARVVKHFHDHPSTSSLTMGYTLPTEPLQEYRHDSDAAWIDRRWDVDVPLVAVARRRDWAKASSGPPAERWASIRQLEQARHLDQGLAWIPSIDAAARPPDFVANRPTRAEMLSDLRSHPRRALETTARIVRARSRGIPYSIPTSSEPAQEPAPPDEPVHARYVGWTGKNNLGDDAMLESHRRLLPWAEVEVSGTPRDLLLLGGGTLINRSTYLGWLHERDSPRIERAVIGTGVASPAYWGQTEPVEGWIRWLESCCYVGVRGPRSAETLREWGYSGPLEVCGDSALVFTRPGGVGRHQGSVVVSPAWTDGELWGGSDEAVMEVLTKAVRGWVAEGRLVSFLSCNADDDRPILEIMRASGRPDLPYLAGYLDLEESLRLLASADLVVAERLHAAVLAAAVGTPFVAVEYRPKLGDFAASVDATDSVVRTDRLDLDSLSAAGQSAVAGRETVAIRVAEHRSRLAEAATSIHRAVRPGAAS